MGTDEMQGFERRRRAWSRYWNSGVLHSCPTSFSDNYDGAIAAFWELRRAAPSGFVRVLDLATGNGAIPRLLSKAGGRWMEIDAVDAADISPRWSAEEGDARVRFHSGVLMEKLPFRDACFDLVCSQFGLEYASRPDAWSEVARVLAPGGRLSLVVHHHRSIFCRTAELEAGHLAWLLASDGLLDSAISLGKWIDRLRIGAMPAGGIDRDRAELSRLQFNRAQEAIDLRLGAAQSPAVLHEVRGQVQAILAGPGQSSLVLQQYRAMLDEARLRSDELVACAMDQTTIEQLLSGMRGTGCMERVRIAEISQAEGILAWGVDARMGG